MKYVLLVGAGFSCNWGGWNATEVNDFLPTVPALRADRHVAQILTRTAGTGGFEEALAEIEDDYDRSPTPENRAHLDVLQSAITMMFLTMETAFKQRPSWDFCNLTQFKTAHFLSGFDAIFSLNQDLLPERHYHDLDLALNQPKKWYGWRRPGIQVFPDPSLTTNEPDKVTWTPRPPPFVIEPSHQPYFKLHGAWNWRSADKRQMLVMGGNKAASINKHSSSMSSASWRMPEKTRRHTVRLTRYGSKFRSSANMIKRRRYSRIRLCALQRSRSTSGFNEFSGTDRKPSMQIRSASNTRSFRSSPTPMEYSALPRIARHISDAATFLVENPIGLKNRKKRLRSSNSSPCKVCCSTLASPLSNRGRSTSR